LTEKQHAILNEKAESTDVPISMLIRIAVDEYINKNLSKR